VKHRKQTLIFRNEMKNLPQYLAYSLARSIRIVQMQIDFAFASKKQQRLVGVCVSFCFMRFFLDLTQASFSL